MTARMWQFYRKCIGFRKTEFETSILDSTYNKDDLGETILGRNTAIRINIRRHISMLHPCTLIDELAHFLENRFFDHVNTFFLPWFDFDKCASLFRLTFIDLTENDISQQCKTLKLFRS